MKPNSIEKLLATDPSKIGNAALKQAVEAQRVQREKQEGELALALLNDGESLISQRVNRVRALRKQEAEEITNLRKLNAAKEAFIAGGDSDAFQKVLREIRGY